MATKQHITYYKDYSIKSYSETIDGIVVLVKRYDKKGNLTYSEFDGNKYTWKLINGRSYNTSTRHSDGMWWKRRFDNKGRMTYEEDQDGVNYDSSKRIEK